MVGGSLFYKYDMECVVVPHFTKMRVLLSALCFFAAGAAQAATINVLREANNPHQSAYGMHPDTGVEGSDLDGAQISATFADGTTETLTWMADRTLYTEPTGESYYGINGAANGNNIDFFMSWQGFEMTTTSLLSSISINVAPGNAVFDTRTNLDTDPNGGSTTGSSFGFEFFLYPEYSALPGVINVAYSGIVNLAGSLAVGDLFTTMTVDFTGLNGGGVLGGLNFLSDLDSMLYANDLTPVPLSTSMAFLLFGLLGLGLVGSRNKTAQPSQIA